MSLKDAAAFIESIPTRYAVLVFHALSARESASIVSHLGIDSGTAIIREMEFGAATAVLRQLSRSDCAAYLNELPARQKRYFEMSLTFAPDSVGYCTTTDVSSLTQDQTADEGLRVIKESQHSRMDAVFIVDDNRKYLGAVSVLTLLRSPAVTKLGTLIDSSLPALSPNATLHHVSKFPAWNDCGQLPVVSRRGELIGALNRTSLAEPHSSNLAHAEPVTRSTTTLIMGAMVDCSIGLAAMLAQPLPVQDTEGESHGG
jgi:Mg/Co/Ni transporter MgtE